MQLLAFWTIENDTVFIDQREVAAIAQKSDGSALGNVDANAVGQNALHAGGLYPGDLLHFAAASVERNAQHAVATVFVKRSKHCFSGYHVVAGDLDLLRLQQKNFRRVQQKISRDIGNSGKSCGDYQPNENGAVKRKILGSEFFAADFHRLLAAEIARLIAFGDFRAIGFGVRRGGGSLSVSGPGLPAVHTTTSFSRFTP